MRGARVAMLGGLALAVLGLAALGQTAEVTDGDRLWHNFTREAAVLGAGQVRLEVRGLTGHDEQSHDGLQVLLRGFPAGDKDLNQRRDDVREISGGVFDLVASYGAFKNTEIGLDLVGINQGIRYDDKSKENFSDLGDMVIYLKHKYAVDERLTMAAGAECSIPTGREGKRLGTGEVGASPFVSGRYKVVDRLTVGAHVGYQLNGNNLDDVFNWSAQALIRGGESYGLRAEVTGRHFTYAGGEFDDVMVAPGVDFKYSKNMTVRPQGLAGITREAIDWGLGIALAYTF